MSSEYMRQIMESIEIAQQINEGYEERVDATVAKLKQYYPDGVYKAEFEKAVERAAEAVGAIEMRPSQPGLNQKPSTARRDFLKDVKAKIGRFKTDTSKADAKRERVNQVLDRLAMVIHDAVGMSFPDGDPFDHIYPKARKMGVPANDVLAWLDRAIRKDGSDKSYHDYLANLWDDQYAHAKFDYDNNRDPSAKYHRAAKDRYDSLGGDNYRNPWR